MNKVQHHLVTIETYADVRLHAYLMSKDERDVQWVANALIDWGEKNNVPMMRIVLATRLTDPAAIEAVRNLLRAVDAEAAKLIDAATDFHYSGFVLRKTDDAPLMDLH